MSDVILSRDRHGTYRLLADGPEAIGRVRAEVWIEDCGTGADPVYHVQTIERADTGERLERDDYDEDDWIEMVNDLTQLFCASLEDSDDLARAQDGDV